MLTTAKEVDGGFVLNGSKTWISNSPIADLFVVWAKCGMSISVCYRRVLRFAQTGMAKSEVSCSRRSVSL